MRRNAGAAIFGAALAGVAAAAAAVALGGGGSGTGQTHVFVSAGSTQFVIANSGFASGARPIDANCYLPRNAAGRQVGSAHLATWLLLSNPRETTITTPDEATSEQNARVLSCLRERGFKPQVRVGLDFRTN